MRNRIQRFLRLLANLGFNFKVIQYLVHHRQHVGIAGEQKSLKSNHLIHFLRSWEYYSDLGTWAAKLVLSCNLAISQLLSGQRDSFSRNKRLQVWEPDPNFGQNIASEVWTRPATDKGGKFTAFESQNDAFAESEA